MLCSLLCEPAKTPLNDCHAIEALNALVVMDGGLHLQKPGSRQYDFLSSQWIYKPKVHMDNNATLGVFMHSLWLPKALRQWDSGQPL